ncbi:MULTISPECIES: hypothetical protein [unclassified Crossiella]|uniref:hypothetical protein n=1 Tax=unclassified Crossiella TaxID=2620835 RepID=UPI001FFE9DA2|nr:MULTISPECIES: hypothetical protein [unclassified Crossiella]MCK2239583.1 hypothetical protein [Crossiella sp. S99.2]MCK2252278.1 hypothetical protein [Crossiella sp. S99.1]
MKATKTGVSAFRRGTVAAADRAPRTSRTSTGHARGNQAATIRVEQQPPPEPSGDGQAPGSQSGACGERGTEQNGGEQDGGGRDAGERDAGADPAERIRREAPAGS